ncbi:MAG: sensor domain-containing diguanylate cyclase [Thermodesulfovibrionales bacterium]|nr:sensor domain-containing diguanylate cyclase [Thermodesulfovibrionales bacterium]
MDYILMGISLLLVVFIVFVVYKTSRRSGIQEGQEAGKKNQEEFYFREILTRDQEIKDLHYKIDNLNELNAQYLAFMFKVPTVIQRLNSTMRGEEIISSVIQLIKDIIPTDIVEFYLYNLSDSTFTMISPDRGMNSEMHSIALGEGIIGLAGKDRIVRINGKIHKTIADNKGSLQSESDIWMAVPIIFRERLLGVIGIGKTRKLAGNESNLMKMIADIAAVALINQTMLGEAKHRANTDPLTGISNRNYFLQMSQTFVEKAIRDHTLISIFLFDIDHFKNYNDTNGHDAGDRLLIDLTRLVSGITRKSAVFARYGGEEFIVMLPGISKEDALIYAERVRDKISQHHFPQREKQPLGYVSVSGGVASFPVDGDSIVKVIQLSDAALYEAKAEGRNQIHVYKPYHFSEEIKAEEHTVSAIPDQRTTL